MNLTTIRAKYTALFSGLSIVFALSYIVNTSFVHKMEDALTDLGQTFNPSISAVLNADRDLYQARVAEISIATSNSSTVNSEWKQDFKDNAEQALERMETYKSLISNYQKDLPFLKQFNKSYEAWLGTANKVIQLAAAGNIDAARALSARESLIAFNNLRDFYDKAGEFAANASKTYTQQIIDETNQSQVFLLIISLMCIGFTLVVGILGPKYISQSLNRLSHQLDDLNQGDGDLSKRLRSRRKDEVGVVANKLDEFLQNLNELIRSIAEQSNEVITGVDELKQGAIRIKTTSGTQSDGVDAIVTAVNEMSYAIKEIAQNATLTSNEIDQVNQLTATGSKITQQAANEMQQLSNTVREASNVIADLSNNSSEIASVLDVIRGIAEQTNLLALNAAIEAARAGEQGRGFAVVADEVRTLASRTQESTQSINAMIETLQSGVEKAVMAIQRGTDTAEGTVDLANQTLDALQQITSACQKVSDVAIQTATATEQQSQVADDISQNLTLLSDQTKDNFHIAENNERQANIASGMASELTNSVSRFKLE
jgi:methyl-accepting chemotaxis protein